MGDSSEQPSSQNILTRQPSSRPGKFVKAIFRGMIYNIADTVKGCA